MGKMYGQCDSCVFSEYDSATDEYVCEAYLDEDEAYRLTQSWKPCPYYRSGDDYELARRQ